MQDETSTLKESNFPLRYRRLIRDYNSDKRKLVACVEMLRADVQSFRVRELEILNAVTAEGVAASVRKTTKLFEKVEWASHRILQKADPTTFEVQRAKLAKTSESVKSRWAAYFTHERGGVEDRSVKVSQALRRANDALKLGLERNQVAADYRQMRELGLLSEGGDDETYGAMLTWQGTRFVLGRLGPWAEFRRWFKRIFANVVVQLISVISLVANVVQIIGLFRADGS